MTIEQLEARRADLVTKLQSAMRQKKQAKAAVAQIEGALLITDEYLAVMKGNGLDESTDVRRHQGRGDQAPREPAGSINPRRSMGE